MLFKISAIRLPAKTNNVPIITIARSSGVSLLSPASVRVDPILDMRKLAQQEQILQTILQNRKNAV